MNMGKSSVFREIEGLKKKKRLSHTATKEEEEEGKKAVWCIGK
jgi:hypothetical protein